MSVVQTLRWAAVYRALSAVAFLFGFGLFALGLSLGWDFDPAALQAGNLDAAVRSVSPLVGGSVALLGLFAWRVGKAAALYYTLSGAVEDRMARRFDAERLKSDILAVLDDRLAGMEAQLQGSNVREPAEARTADQFQQDDRR